MTSPIPPSPPQTDSPQRFLVIRRDNIGDLLCTTPLIRALRLCYPKAWIGALVNSYNAPVLSGSRDLDEVFIYEKLKHLPRGRSRIGALLDRLSLIRRLRASHIDYAILAAPGRQPSTLRFARMLSARRIVGHASYGAAVDIAVPEAATEMHEVEACFRLLQPFGIAGSPPAMSITVDEGQVEAFRQSTGWHLVADGQGPLVGLHISARKPAQRWPIERFAELAQRLHDSVGARFLLFWAPGGKDNPLHPGDDEKARALTEMLANLPIFPMETHRLPELIAGLSLCDRVVCSDGGAMHIAAALGKSVVCFFGNSDATRWRPWNVPHVILQKESREVVDISVDDAVNAFLRLT